jgi:hypothetical protein
MIVNFQILNRPIYHSASQNCYFLQYSTGNCYQDRLRQGCRSRAYKDLFTACLDNSFQSYIITDGLQDGLISGTGLESAFGGHQRAFGGG